MKNKRRRAKSLPPFVRKAERALREAVAEVIEARRRSGHPLVVSRDGQVVAIPADQLVVREPSAEYRKRKR